jgi:hypothetical protein
MTVAGAFDDGAARHDGKSGHSLIEAQRRHFVIKNGPSA